MDKSLRLSVILATLDRATKPLRAIKGQSDATSTALKETRQRLKGLEAAQKDVASYRGLQTSIVETRLKLQAQRQTVDQLRAAYLSADRPTKQLTTNYNNARSALDRLEGKQRDQIRGLAQLDDRLSAAGVETRDLARHEGRLADEIAGANRQIDAQKQKLRELGARQGHVNRARGRSAAMRNAAGELAAGGAGAMGAGFAVLAPMNGAIEQANEVEARLTTIGQRSDMNAEATRRYGRELDGVSRRANALREDVIAVVDVLTAAGQTENQALNNAEPITRAATAYRESGEDIARATNAMQQNLKVLDTGLGLDVMAAAGKRGAFEMGDMAREFPTMTASYEALRETGIRAVADLAAASQIALRGAGSPEEAANNLNNVLQKIASPETERRFARIGINLRREMEAARAAGQTPLEAITRITQRALDGGAQLGQLFEDAQVQRGLRPLMANLEEYLSIREEAMNSRGVVDADFARRMEDEAEQARAGRIAAAELATTLGAQLAPAQSAVWEIVQKVSTAYGEWAERHPGLSQAILMIVAAIAALLVVFGGIMLAIAAILAPLAVMNVALAGTGIAVNAILWPVLLVIAAIALLAAGAYLIYKNWGPISDFFRGLWERIKNVFAPAVAFFTGLWKGFSEAMAPVFEPIGRFIDWLGRMIPIVAGVMWQFSPLRYVLMAIGAVFNWLTTPIRFTVDQIRQAGVTGEMVGRALGEAVKFIINPWQGLMTFFGWLKDRFLEIGRDLIMGLINGILGKLGELRRTITDAASSAARWFKERMGIHSPSRVFMAFGDHTMAGLALGIERARDRPLEALGGVGAAMTGALALGSPAAALSPPAGAPAPATIGGNIYNLNIYGLPGMDLQQLADEIMRRLQELEDQTRRRTFGDDDD